MKSMIKKSILIALIFSIFACDVDSNCNTLNVDFVTFQTFTIKEGEEEQVQVIFDSIVSPESDSTFFQSDTLSIFELPLNPGSNQTSFYFYYGPFVDSIEFNYETRNAVDSPECGIDLEFVGMDTTFQTFDSLVIVNDTLKRTVNAPNIKLYIF
ncbi:DUF6452 family protein [Marivirga arenosa]|uniref:DUF6452 family protein n=1 Tax=Marivirga arenosa TaxID=3059076 RepID=A0AA51ZWS7_9BACT|nr:DUF6452 family protein [Marivirga sp. BKB1-2]WNB18177.1 DUF6452 family protein [Marivirga sp. BKB1-2]